MQTSYQNLSKSMRPILPITAINNYLINIYPSLKKTIKNIIATFILQIKLLLILIKYSNSHFT